MNRGRKLLMYVKALHLLPVTFVLILPNHSSVGSFFLNPLTFMHRISGHFALFFVLVCDFLHLVSCFHFAFHGEITACFQHSMISEGLNNIWGMFHIYSPSVSSVSSCYFSATECVCVIYFNVLNFLFYFWTFQSEII